MSSLSSIDALFPQDLLGCIIGQGGARINEVRQENNVQVSTDKEVYMNEFRQVHITGEWVKIWSAFCDILRTVQNGDDFGRRAAGQQITVQLKIPACIAGMVIGKGGAQLNEWRQSFPQCKFKLEEGSTDSAVRFFRIHGEPSDLMEAASSFVDVLEEALEKHGIRTRDDLGGGGGNSNANGGGNQMKRKQGGGGGEMNNNAMQNPFSQFGGMQLNQHAGMGNQNFGDGKRRRGNNGGQMGGSFDGGHKMMGNMQSVATMECLTTVQVEEPTIAKIIGPKGGRIMNIRRCSQCQITTDQKGDRSDGMREVQIRGYLPHVSTALMMINSLVTSEGHGDHWEA